jgi:hypothetical protein
MRLASERLTKSLSRRTKSLFFGDAAYLLKDVATGEYDTYNNPVISTSEIPIECSFTDKPATETWRDFADIENIHAEVRFMEPRPAKGDRVKVVGRFDTETMTDQEYEIVGIRDRDTFGYVCALMQVQV